VKSTADRDAWVTLETQTSLIEELDGGTFTSTIEIGEAMLRIKLECGDLLERERWLAEAQALQAKVRAAHVKALKFASDAERSADTALQAARINLRRAAQAAHAAGLTERDIAEATGRSSTAAHYFVTNTSPQGDDPASQRRAKRIAERAREDKKRR
jgi:hypothetical protein